MDTLADLLARGRERDGVAFDAPDRATGYSYREFCTNAWKAGNLLRHYGVREGATLAVVVGPKDPEPEETPGRLATAPDPLLAAFGGALLGARIQLSPGELVDADALVAPDAWLSDYETAPGTARLAYGGPPDDADVAHFERQLWSENPVAPPEDVDPEVVVFEGASASTHGELVAAAEDVVEAHGVATDERVAVDAPLAPDVFVAGVLAPLVAGATILGGPNADGDLVVGAGGDVVRGGG